MPYGELIRLMDTLRAAGYLKIAFVGLEGPPVMPGAPGATAPAGEEPTFTETDLATFGDGALLDIDHVGHAAIAEPAACRCWYSGLFMMLVLKPSGVSAPLFMTASVVSMALSSGARPSSS